MTRWYSRLALAAACLAALAHPAAAQFLYSSDTGGTFQRIADFHITVSDSFVINNFPSVRINRFSDYTVQELFVELAHNNRVVFILNFVTGQSVLNGNYTFVAAGGNDFNQAAANAGVGVVPDTVPYATVPGNNGPLSSFIGTNVEGDWRLTIGSPTTPTPISFAGWQFIATPTTNYTLDGPKPYTISDDSFRYIPSIIVGQTTPTNLTLTSGAAVQDIQAYQTSKVFMNGGTVTNLTARSSAQLFVNDGTVGVVGVANTAVANLSGTVGSVFIGNQGVVNVNGGTVDSLNVAGIGVAHVNGGTVNQAITSNNARAYLLAGSFTDLTINDSSQVFVYGGGISSHTIRAYGDAQVYLYGTDLAIDWSSAVHDDIEGGTFYDLTGFLTDGTPLSTRFFDADGGRTFDPTNSILFFNDQSVVNGGATAPEPGVLPLMLLGLALGAVGCERILGGGASKRRQERVL